MPLLSYTVTHIPWPPSLNTYWSHSVDASLFKWAPRRLQSPPILCSSHCDCICEFGVCDTFVGFATYLLHLFYSHFWPMFTAALLSLESLSLENTFVQTKCVYAAPSLWDKVTFHWYWYFRLVWIIWLARRLSGIWASRYWTCATNSG